MKKIIGYIAFAIIMMGLISILIINRNQEGISPEQKSQHKYGITKYAGISMVEWDWTREEIKAFFEENYKYSKIEDHKSILIFHHAIIEGIDFEQICFMFNNDLGLTRVNYEMLDKIDYYENMDTLQKLIDFESKENTIKYTVPKTRSSFFEICNTYAYSESTDLEYKYKVEIINSTEDLHYEYFENQPNLNEYYLSKQTK